MGKHFTLFIVLVICNCIIIQFYTHFFLSTIFAKKTILGNPLKNPSYKLLSWPSGRIEIAIWYVQMGLQFRFQPNCRITIAMWFRFGIEENKSFFTSCCVGPIEESKLQFGMCKWDCNFDFSKIVELQLQCDFNLE